MIDFKLLGATLQMHRKAKRLTQKQLAEKAGISKEHLQLIETGKTNFTVKVLNKILNALDLKIVCRLESDKK